MNTFSMFRKVFQNKKSHFPLLSSFFSFSDDFLNNDKVDCILLVVFFTVDGCFLFLLVTNAVIVDFFFSEPALFSESNDPLLLGVASTTF